jgi:hypothetical protein
VAHLGVSALAGVLAQRIRQGDYLLQGSQDGTLDVASAGVALGQVEPSSAEFAVPRAGQTMEFGLDVARNGIFIPCYSFTGRRLVATNAIRS